MNERPRKICHISTVHTVNDIRVFHKECLTLVSAGYDVTLIACDAEVKNSKVTLIRLSNKKGRIHRILFRAYRAYRLAQEQQADIYHFHDPELLPYGLLLKHSMKARVIFDSHECYPDDILAKAWIPVSLRAVIAFFYKRFEDFIVRRLDLVVAATPHIENRFLRISRRTVTINNYPLRGEFSHAASSGDEKRDGFCYVGAISFVRGILPLLDALDNVGVGIKFYLAGQFASADVEAAVRTHRNWPRVTFCGQLRRTEVGDIYRKSIAGVVNFLVSPNHIYSQPNKLFEYMAAGIPVICSNFPLWRQVVENGNCGVCIDPESGSEIAAAVNAMFNDAAYRRQLSENGSRLVNEFYSWDSEGTRLIEEYRALDNEPF